MNRPEEDVGRGKIRNSKLGRGKRWRVDVQMNELGRLTNAISQLEQKLEGSRLLQYAKGVRMINFLLRQTDRDIRQWRNAAEIDHQ